ncbi:MarR family winged helix-turn-helix transcriptional regulator [Methylophilus sp. Q8]|uniref:MarR family winged helix-turn-helix transcriptional regulator n=1 Tax=Methylophilus sp. Q8 TaxID=1506586 RepID=UPI001F268B8A|nr:MarR family transcriptional regulator [Methylophilus sp. Q8]
MMINKVDIVNNNPDDTHQVFETIHRLMHIFRARQYRLIQDSGVDLTHMQHKVLGYFARHPDATLSDLVADSGKDKAQIARLITEVRAKGLLDAKPDPSDKRVSRLSLTPSGAEVFESLKKAERQLSDLAVQGLSEEECNVLLTLLGKIKNNISTQRAN